MVLVWFCENWLQFHSSNFDFPLPWFLFCSKLCFERPPFLGCWSLFRFMTSEFRPLPCCYGFLCFGMHPYLAALSWPAFALFRFNINPPPLLLPFFLFCLGCSAYPSLVARLSFLTVVWYGLPWLGCLLLDRSLFTVLGLPEANVETMKLRVSFRLWLFTVLN